MSLIRRLSRRFSSRPTRRRQEYSDGKSRDKDSIACKVNLLDGGVLSFNVEVSGLCRLFILIEEMYVVR